MFLNIMLFICIMIFSYTCVCKFRENQILYKINYYIRNKNEKYYEEYLKKYEKSKKVKIVDKLNVVYKINLLIERAGVERRIVN